MTRAMLKMGNGQYEEAWSDLLACHRLARHVGRGATLIESLVGFALDSIAIEGDLVLISQQKVTTKQIRKFVADLQKLPPIALPAEKVNLGERFMFLDSAMMIRRGNFDVDDLIDARPDKNKSRMKPTDWNIPLRMGNQLYDRMVRTMRMKNREARKRAFERFDDELRTARVKSEDPTRFYQLWLREKSLSKARGILIGERLTALLLPAIARLSDAYERAQQQLDNLQVACALATHYREKGSYPKHLSELEPKHVAKLPRDVFSGKDLIYRSTGKSYLLYSVGVNEIDDQGIKDDFESDDLSVRMPLKETAK